ncbi:alpha/beta hydrolase [Pseudomonas chlororaphis]|uniref:AB hydrolase-1 domain-containing protein n=1 Tax=Pseudomonas chlororaphis TaxID=587753 RepID=A0A1Q8EMC5_9PSED|nr:alpha/beta hydrolase [Pseudomonas chlororaphis]OLF52935.1 hypothetical protein BTN82_19375 [Pseudomonas chlororaphis]
MTDIYKYRAKKINFPSQGVNIVGLLCVPTTKPKGAITIFGPIAFVKEQSPTQYATRLAKEGYITLIYDPRFYGESDGLPRQYEDRKSRCEDILASVDYLASLEIVEKDKIYALGICQGANWIAEASTIDPRIKKVMLVASALLSPAMGENYLSKEDLDMKVKRGRHARQRFEQDAEVAYMNIGPGPDNLPAIMPFQHITDWYGSWTIRSPFTQYKGNWENRITQSSEELVWSYDVSEVMSLIEKPVLMIHSDKAASGPTTPKKMFSLIPSKDKTLIWFEGDQVQYQFYEDPLTIDSVIFELTHWLKK